MAGIASVVVSPEYRGRGVGSMLMRGVLARSVEQGFPLTALYPATTVIYRHLGYEFGGGRYRFSFPAADLRSLGGKDVSIRRAGPADAGRFLELVAESHAAGRVNGPLVWAESKVAEWLEDEDNFGYLADDGFVVYNWHDSDLRIDEIVAGSEATARALWATVGSGSSIATNVQAYIAPNDPVHLLVNHEADKHAQLQRWMLRVLDAPAAIAARGFAPGADGGGRPGARGPGGRRKHRPLASLRRRRLGSLTPSTAPATPCGSAPAASPPCTPVRRSLRFADPAWRRVVRPPRTGRSTRPSAAPRRTCSTSSDHSGGFSDRDGGSSDRPRGGGNPLSTGPGASISRPVTGRLGLSNKRSEVVFMRVLGVDPGLTRCGLGIVEGTPGRPPTADRRRGDPDTRRPGRREAAGPDRDGDRRVDRRAPAGRGRGGAGVRPAERADRDGHRPGVRSGDGGRRAARTAGGAAHAE